MTGNLMLTAETLEEQIRKGIPIAAQMAFQVRDLQPDSIWVVGGEEENINVHGTAFAGSLYAICTLALWGLVTSQLPEDTTLVLAKGHIRYHQPVVGEIEAHCTIAQDRMEAFLSELHKQGRSRLDAIVELPGIEGPAVEFKGTVYARLSRSG
jgi:thioesterase domain-containing protein